MVSKFKKKPQVDRRGLSKPNSFDYDAKSEKAFCESIPKGIKWSLHENVYHWTYSEVHSKGKNEIRKEYDKKYTPDVNFGTFDLELKGYLRPDAKKRMEVFRKMYPEADIRVAFQKDLPVRKGAKRKYSDWARINGYKWCIAKTFDDLPEEWKKEIKDAKK
jgi:hypothetical protein